MAKGLRGPVGAAFMPLKGRGRCLGDQRQSLNGSAPVRPQEASNQGIEADSPLGANQ